MIRLRPYVALSCGLGLLAVVPVAGQSLRSSSISRQNEVATRHGLPFVRDSEMADQLVQIGHLVPIVPNGDFTLKDVSFPFALPVVRDFVLALAAEHREVCGEPLMVTSLLRPKNRQPRNASSRTVHPTGMALDMRRTWNTTCRRWLDQTLLALESAGVLEAAIERNPAHYHVALFPTEYRDRGEEIVRQDFTGRYFVVPGDTLWKIAKRHGTSVEAVKAANRLRRDQIYPGQMLMLPTGR